eukprot:1187227-Rhodomonas_salina.1
MSRLQVVDKRVVTPVNYDDKIRVCHTPEDQELKSFRQETAQLFQSDPECVSTVPWICSKNEDRRNTRLRPNRSPK